MDYDSDENGNAGDSGPAERGGLSSCGYCGKLRNLNIVELMCSLCGSWFHESCISYQLGKLVPFMLNYSFTCKNCSNNSVELFKKSQAQLRDMCITAIANLQHQTQKDKGTPTLMFSLAKDIIPFLEQHWEALTTASRRSTQTWHTTIQRTLMKEADTTFRVEETNERGETTSQHPFFGLSCSDLTLIRPMLDLPNETSGSKGRTKRKLPDNLTGSKKGRSDMPAPKLHGYPVDHPYNKDGYRYVLAEPDPHAPFRQEFDESSDWAGKPIPGWLYRVVSPSAVLLALHDRAPQLKPANDRLAVIGDKGYCLIRATHGVSHGSWYFEMTMTDQPPGTHVRIGWGQEYANLQAPLGYDKFGYSIRSRKGTVFHESHGKTYARPGFSAGDVIGAFIHLPEEGNPVDKFPSTYKDKPLVKFRSHLYYEDKDDIANVLKTMKPLTGSKITFFRNGEELGTAFSDIYGGIYYPSFSLYKNVKISTNFGPTFKFPPTKYSYKPMSERSSEGMIEQTLSDATYFLENQGKLSLDLQ